MSQFRFKREGYQLFVRLDDPHDKWELLCTVVKHDHDSWTRYVLEQLELAEAVSECGLTKENILAIARIYQATKEDPDQE